jgi:ankyrin repeat protein
VSGLQASQEQHGLRTLHNSRRAAAATPSPPRAAAGIPVPANTPQAKELIARGAEPNARDKQGHCPAHYAAAHGHVDVLQVQLCWACELGLLFVESRMHPAARV